MLYTVGETAKILGVAPSTLRYYDKEGLLPFVERSNGGMRVFQEKDFTWLYLVECLKRSGLSIKEIRHYLELTRRGDATIEERLEMLQKQRERVRKQMEELQNTLSTLDYKCWYYETAQKAGTTAVPQGMSLEEIPEEFRPAKEALERVREHKRG